jgi:hypothetical protein
VAPTDAENVVVDVPPLVTSRAPAPNANAAKSRCPAEMALTGDVCMDRWEAHLITRYAEGHPSEVSPYARPNVRTRYEAESSAGMVPQGYLSRVEAATACGNAGKRLCSAREWFRACEGTKKTTFPYGDHARAGTCNTGKPHLMHKLFGGDMSIYRFDAHYNSPKLNQKAGYLAKTGEYADCVSEDGVFDLVGNLHEWVADAVDGTFRKLLTERRVDYRVFETATDGNAAFLGGFYSTTDEYGEGCKYVTPAHEAAYHDYSTGFRCCKDPTP